jgi:DNA end-binding protein Ku
MLDLAKHIVNQKSGRCEPEKFEDLYETALIDLINQKRNPIVPKERPRGESVVDLMEALRKSVGRGRLREQGSEEEPQEATEGRQRPKGMLMPIAGKKQAKETAAKKPAGRQRKSA